MTDTKNGAQHLVDALVDQGIVTVYSLSGNQIMPVYDALIGSGIRLIHTRHEGAAVYMAEAHAQLTGATAVALLTAGPGFANGLSAMYSAKQSQTPLLVLTGDAPIAIDGRGGFQEMDQQRAAASLAKATYRIGAGGEAFDLLRHAFAVAAGGTPGPVHVSLPDDVLRQVEPRRETSLPIHREQPTATAGPLTLAASVLDPIRQAKRPIIVGGPCFARAAWKDAFQRAADRSNIPFLALESPRGLRAPRIGALASVMAEADLVVLLSIPPDFMLGFGEPFGPKTRFLCFHDDGAVLDQARHRLGRERVLHLGLAGAAAFHSLGDTEACDRLSPNAAEAGWRARVEAAIAWRPAPWRQLPATASPFHAAAVAYSVESFIDAHPDLSLTIDGGEVGQWCQAILDAKHAIINGPSGAIGGSIPYAIAAKAARPDQPSIALLGDGTAGFYFMEFETAIREHLPFVAIVGNDAKWNAEHQIQVRDYGENRTFGCEMHPTRYDEIAKAMGGYGENITNVSDIVPAIERAIASGKPACLNVAIQSIPAPLIKRD